MASSRQLFSLIDLSLDVYLSTVYGLWYKWSLYSLRQTEPGRKHIPKFDRKCGKL